MSKFYHVKITYTLLLQNMSSNRVSYFIRNILQNSQLNREKFIKNKIKYNILKTTNKTNNINIKRNMSTLFLKQ